MCNHTMWIDYTCVFVCNLCVCMFDPFITTKTILYLRKRKFKWIRSDDTSTRKRYI